VVDLNTPQQGAYKKLVKRGISSWQNWQPYLLSKNTTIHSTSFSDLRYSDTKPDMSSQQTITLIVEFT
jgi:hypothetical protein